MTVSEAITFWERRHHRLRMVAIIAFAPATNPAKRLKAFSIMERWATPHMRMWQRLAETTKPIPKLKSQYPTGAFAIVGEGGKELIQIATR